MGAAAIIAGALLAVGLLLWLLDRRRRPSESDEHDNMAVAPAAETSGEECCGQHYSCEKDSLLTALASKIEYYDDEYLDRFAGRDAREYTETEKEEFRDVLMTLLPSDLPGWGRSIQLRGINLPEEIRDEFLMLIDERRRNQGANMP
ncbi:MAG: phospholipase [Muribaculaceae bacterium]|nr:phospholipase [Muribaculaceae bacterium]